MVFVDNALIGAGLRDRVKIAASGKIVSAYDIVRVCSIGADWCNMARPFMFSIAVFKQKIVRQVIVQLVSRQWTPSGIGSLM